MADVVGIDPRPLRAAALAEPRPTRSYAPDEDEAVFPRRVDGHGRRP